jgi:hypothetical protein
LLLYDSPDLLISAAAEQQEGPLAMTSGLLIQGYLGLLDWSRRWNQPLLAGWQLRKLGLQGLRQWLVEGDVRLGELRKQDFQPEQIPPLLAAVTRCLTDAEPQILDVYQEIELRASLLGREPDIMYSKRLQHSSKDEDVLLRCFVDSLRMPSEILELKRYLADRDIALREALEELKTQSNEIKTLRELQISLKDSHRLELEKLLKEQESKHTVHQQELADLRQQYESQLLDLRQCLNDRETELQEARGEGELTITQLHHVQEELEVFFLSDQDKQKQLEEQAKAIQTLTETQDTLKKTHRKELEKLRKGQETKHSVHQQELADLSQQFDAKLVDLQSQLNDRETELRDAREEAELTVAQLHQVQEELENYFLMSRAGEQLIQAQDEQLQRAQRLLARLQKQGSLSMANPPAMTVEVLPSRPRTASGAMSLQTEALLSAYGASLRRANELLTRAKRL